MTSLGINVTAKGPVRGCVHCAPRQLLLFGFVSIHHLSRANSPPAGGGCVLAPWASPMEPGMCVFLKQGKDRRNHLSPSSSRHSLYDNSSLSGSKSFRGCNIWPTFLPSFAVRRWPVPINRCVMCFH
jgi:hypothetical protein